MKKKNLIIYSLILFPTLPFLSSCNNNSSKLAPIFEEDEISYQKEEYETYHNYIEIFDDKGTLYQIGDPYILRYNGKYYLYSSNTGTNINNGIPCWVSSNLVDWTFDSWVYGDGTTNSGGAYTYTAFAPEVTYYNGYFYMCEAPNGNGHYIFRCDTPDGKFERVSDNIGLGIDGSLYVENGKLYLLSAASGYSGGSIGYALLTVGEDGRVTAGVRNGINVATLNGWTEGPGYFERNGYRYLTYTGNHVNASSYRVAYAYTNSTSLFKSLVTTDNNIILISTGDTTPYPYEGGYNGDPTQTVSLDTYRGLGHSANVLGPNLDSEYISYHNAGRITHNNLSTTPKFNRRLNVSQLFTDNKNLSVNGLCIYDTVKPTLPDFSLVNNPEEDKLDNSSNEYNLSNKMTGDIYTVEFNIKLDSLNKANVVFSYVDDNNFSSVEVDGETIKLHKTTEGEKETLLTSQILVSDNKDAYHTIKVVNGQDKCSLYYDNDLEGSVSTNAGKEGYVGVSKDLVMGEVSFTNDAYGTSDFEAIKNLGAQFPSINYLKEEKRGFSIANATLKEGGVRQNEKENTSLVNEETLVTLNKNDWVKYAINAPTEGDYGLYLKVNNASLNSKFRVVIDDTDVFDMSISDATIDEDNNVFVYTGLFNIKEKGIHSLKILCDSKELSFSMVETRKSDNVDSFENSLTEEFEQSTTIMGSYKTDIGGLQTKTSEVETMIYFGDSAKSNFELNVNVALIGGDAGIVFRTKNYSYTTISGSVNGSNTFQGYYLSLQTNGIMNLYKYNYGYDTLETVVPEDNNGNLLLGVTASIKVSVKVINNVIKVSLNNKEYISISDTDPFINGYVGFYTKNTQISYKDLEYKII
ncbi:MAG: family 43 glycosylhydrolase [Bacilli bacterium]